MRNKIDVLAFLDELSRDSAFEDSFETQLELSFSEDSLARDFIQEEYIKENHLV